MPLVSFDPAQTVDWLDARTAAKGNPYLPSVSHVSPIRFPFAVFLLALCFSFLAPDGVARGDSEVRTHSGAPATTAFGPSNPFFAPSALPFGAPPFDRKRRPTQSSLRSSPRMKTRSI
jgi:hypothetical protein